MDVKENLGKVNELIRQAIVKSRNISEPAKLIVVQFKVDLHRWNEKRQLYYPWELHFDSEKALLDDLLTKAGRDLIHNASFMTGAQPAALTYYAICNPGAFNPLDTDTTLATELTAPSLCARHQPTGAVNGVTESFTHGASGNTTVVIAGFKNNGGGPVTGIKGYGNFNAAGPPPAGTLGTESAFTALDLNVNDILKLTVTLTLG